MPRIQKAGTKLYFENLDGLRFFCFLSVFFFHSFITDNIKIQQSGVYFFFKTSLFGNGFLGVNFFFVLSGFLITYLLIQEKKTNNFIQVGNFWMRRILRIWPLYFACLFFGFVIFPFVKKLTGGIPAESASPLYYISFLSNFDYIKKGQPDAMGLGVLWSVAVEEQFYLIWPIILSVFPVKKFWIPLLTILICSLVFRAMNDVPILHEMHTISCIGDMAIGGLGAWLIIEKNAFRTRIYYLPKLAIILVYAVFLLIFLFRGKLLLSTYYLRIFERSFTASVILFIILEQCYAKNSFYKMGNFKLATRLGVVTYGLYCLHFIVISGIMGLARWMGWNNEVWEVIILETSVSLFVSVNISLLSYRYFERPFLQLKEKFSPRGNINYPIKKSG
jgi:peptidoglycan/LPS O-acetylase OafA/YrhL